MINTNKRDEAIAAKTKVYQYYPELNAEEVRKAILDSATRYADERVIGPGERGTVRFGDLSVTGGVVNAYAAIRLAEQMAAAKR